MSEKELLQYIQRLSRNTGFSGTGDDAAVFDGWVFSTDQFIEGTHFTLTQMSPEDIGFKGVVQALSDLAAMAARPQALLCSASWPQESEPVILRVYKGIESACHEYGIPLIGGDISRASSIFLDFTVIGKDSGLIKKNQPGDVLAVTGPVGSALGGFKTLSEKESYPELALAFRRPRAHIQTALELQKTGALTGLTDISDGLAKSVHHLAALGGCGFQVDLEKIPYHEDLKKLCQARQWPLRDFLLGGGEDYQLLVTIKSEMIKKFNGSLLLDHGLTVIGQAVADKNSLIADGEIQDLPEVGWDPFVVV